MGRKFLAQFASALDEAIQSTAKDGGVLDEYNAVIKEYRQGMNLNDAWQWGKQMGNSMPEKAIQNALDRQRVCDRPQKFAVNAKAKGSFNEHRSIALLESAGYCCTRSSASLGGFDIVGISATDVVLVQCKSRDWPGSVEMETIRNFPCPPLCKKIIHRWRDRYAYPMSPPLRSYARPSWLTVLDPFVVFPRHEQQSPSKAEPQISTSPAYTNGLPQTAVRTAIQPGKRLRHSRAYLHFDTVITVVSHLIGSTTGAGGPSPHARRGAAGRAE